MDSKTIRKVDETEIDLKYLFYKIIIRWRTIVLITLSCSLIGAFFQCYKLVFPSLNTNYKTEVFKKYQTELGIYENKVADLESIVNILSNKITKQQEYIKESIIMNLDRTNVYRSSFNMIINCKNKDDNQIVGNLYLDYINNGQIFKDIKEKIDYFNYDTKYIADLVNASFFDGDYETRCGIKIVIRSDNKQKSEELLTLVLEGIDRKQKEISKEIIHNISIYNVSTLAAVDDELRIIQQSNIDYLNNVNNNLDKYTEKLENLKSGSKPIFEFDCSYMIKSIIKWMALGTFFGFGISCLYFALRCINEKTIRGEAAVNNYMVNELGNVCVYSEKKSKIDKFIDRRFHYKNTNLNYDDLCSLTFSNIVSVLPNKNENIAIIGSTDIIKIKKICESLNKNEKAIYFDCVGDILNNSKSISNLSKYKFVIIALEDEKTLKIDLINQLNKLDIWNKVLLGVIILN